MLPHVRKKDLPAIFARLKALDLATPNAGLITDIIACPGLDYCDLANARSIPDRPGASPSASPIWTASTISAN